MGDVFGAVVGNTALRQRLGNDILSKKLPHAIIFEGPHGTGKHTLATMAAAALACESSDKAGAPLPCGTCIQCRKIIGGRSPDVITVGRGDKATIGVDAIRFLKEDVSIVPNDSDSKVYIIEDADKMTEQAQNALLLTLEEPPAYVRFFLLCENAGLLLETIRSRAPVMRTELLSEEEVDGYITKNDRRAAQMKLSDPQGYAELLKASGNGIGRAIELLEPKNLSPVKQRRELATGFVTAVLHQGRAADALTLLKSFSSKREPLSEQLEAVSDALRDLIILKKSDDARLIFFADRERAMELSDKASIAVLYELIIAVDTARDEISKNANVRLCLFKLALSSGLIKQ